MKKILILAVGLISACYSAQSMAQETEESTGTGDGKTLISFNGFIREGDYQDSRFFFSGKIGAPVAKNNWIGLSVSYDKQKVPTDYSFFDNQTIYSESKLLGIGAFYRVKYPLSDRFFLSNDIEFNVLFDTEDSETPKPIQGAVSLHAEYNPNDRIGIRLGLGHFSIVSVDSQTFIDLNYLFSSPSAGIVFYF